MPLPPLASPPQCARRARGLALAIPSAAFLMLLLLSLNLMQLGSLLVRPFSRRLYRRINRWGAKCFWGWCAKLGELLHGIEVIRSGDAVLPNENAIVLSNHQQMADITFLFFLAREGARLGDIKWMVKDAIKWVPGVGWGLYLLDSFFLKRDWARDRARINDTFARVIDDAIPFWLMTFVEGTRVTQAKIERGQAWAAEHGLPRLEHVLTPRTKGFIASLTGLEKGIDAIYDVTIGYIQGVPSLWQYIQGFARRAHLHVRRYPLAALPSRDEERAAWLHERWQEKDDLLEHFYARGSFSAS